MDIAALLLESVLPLAVYVLPILIPVMIVMRLFRFKDVVVKLMDEVRRNPDAYKNNPEAVKALLTKMQRGSSRPPAGGGRPAGGPAPVKRSSSVPPSRGGGVLPSGRDLRTVTPSKRSTPLRGTARMTQSRQEHKLKTTVAVLLLLGGVTMLFSTYFYGYQYEPFFGGIVLMGAGLYLLKTDVERV